jgi:serine/threonine-protein kinase PknG
LIAPQVPERRRFCSSCDAALKRDSGFCPKCGQEYSFVATLAPGDVVQGKYEVKGTIAFGGLGWIYLALDTVLNRWVTMKGLLNAKDPHLVELAVREREYLAQVKHPNIVGIYDFLTHGGQGFIVMEYVNGKTLMSLRKERGGPIPPAEAISYIAEVLPAFQYLDDMGLVYCDFKPDNVMVEEDTVKLIDLGAVRRFDDTGGDVYGSRGYTAPEAGQTPTAVSDLYSVARALAVMVASFDFQGKHEHSLPPASEVPIFAQHESLYRFLRKATREKPDERFQTAAEMGEQLLGVLRSVAPEADLGPIESALFDRESPSGNKGNDGLPRLKVPRDDAAAGVIMAAGALPDPARRLEVLERANARTPTLELGYRIVDELVSLGRHADAEKKLAELVPQAGTDWRIAWYRGRMLLARGESAETVKAFHGILDELPGELGPAQALGRAYEAAGDPTAATAYYDAVSKADPAFTGAAFGLARCLAKRGDRSGAAAAYARVPASSSRFAEAQLALAELLSSGLAPSLDDLTAAGIALEALTGLVDGMPFHAARAEVFTRAIPTAKHAAGKAPPLLGVPFDEKALRLAAETEYRTCARYAETADERVALVDRANDVRPVTFT